MIYGVATNDAEYETRKVSIFYENGIKKRKQLWACPFYVKWMQMLQRCFCVEYKNKKPTYADVTCCDDWLLFSNFKKWMESQDYGGKELDKDLLVFENKIYSPESCCFISRSVNSFLTLRSSMRGDYPLGVSYHKRDHVFLSSISGGKDKKIHLGSFDDKYLAHRAWQIAKLDKCKAILTSETDPVVIRGLNRVINKLSEDTNNGVETKSL